MRHLNKHTCSRAVDFEVENGVVTSCQFIGGCDGKSGRAFVRRTETGTYTSYGNNGDTKTSSSR